MTVIGTIGSIAENMHKEQTSLEEALKQSLRVSVSDADMVDGVDRLIYNHCLNKTELRDLIGGSKPTFNKKLKEVMDEGLISEPIYQNRSHLFTNEQVHMLLDYFDFPKYADNHNGKTITVTNHKGGTGKTSTTLALATATALDLNFNARVCVLDLDPQGSAGQGTMQLAEDSIYVTMADLLLAEFESQDENNAVNALLENGYSFEDIVKACPFSTHLTNLSVITAFPSDERFVDRYWQLEESEQDRLLTKLSKVVLPLLKEEFDIIYIDMPPQDSPITWSALEATDCILVPVTPRYYDYASTANFMTNLHERLQRLPSEGQNIEWVKMAAVNYNENSKPEYQTVQKLLRSVRNHLFTQTLAHSDAFTAAAEIGRTVLDIKKSEEICTAHQFDVAVDSVRLFYNQFKNEIVALAAK
ncbi:ParA family protein [Vibrio mediterranei]|jgi:cellulose biosynthesis protein BcsQ|uniref:ParA family protein n=1 Tax=Vibrio mediterranei TaxID=689 RepID=UPI001EFDD210|nr:ParA family protein [Vibrio mediterranei]MCG9661323.1 ParA family protein [Vibrio mediterranei]